MHHVVNIITVVIIAMLTLYYSIALHVRLISFYHISMLTLHIMCTLVVTNVMLWSIECKKQRLIFIEIKVFGSL